MKIFRTSLFSILCVLLLSFGLVACKGWFEVTPSSEIRGEQHYKTIKGFQQTLTGCYISMTLPDLYGKALTWHIPEILSHQYKEPPSSNTMDSELFKYKYSGESSVVNYLDNVWSKMYNVIVNANEGLKNIELRKDELLSTEYSIIKGEFLALRALLHFDLLRLYGFGNYAGRPELANKLTIPFVATLNKNAAPQLTGAAIYEQLSQDLAEAAALLKEYDPIANPDKNDDGDFKIANADGYFNKRDYHLNYYAVKALEARVHLWFGTEEAIQKAHDAALEVVTASENGTLNKNKSINTNIRLLPANEVNPSRVSLADEALFRLDIPSLKTKTAEYFKPNHRGGDSYAMTILVDRVNNLYGQNHTDVRFTRLLEQSPNTKMYTPLKYTGEADKHNSVNIIRLPEVYYILAETYLHKGEVGEAVKQLNRIRTLRSIPTPLKETLSKDEVMKEIYLEYQREFIAEGVLFFYQKRRGEKSVSNLPEDITMDDRQYVIPFPDHEIKHGRVQF